MMKVRMKHGLCDIYQSIMPKEFDDDVEDFLNSIDGKDVELVFIGPDAFEKNDNNYWLPNELWENSDGRD